ncbi:ABC transporter substrate-binding protein [Mesorhizobium sp. NPDC059054]|uniref:ABC transporter substrate-binding protein n=1 Tax=Mesorhizobium sp. NPDC059054 TaxID=3346711 RepID=UPI00367718E8
MHRLGRRAFLGIAASAFLPALVSAGPQRLAIIDWGVLETALAIGAVPLAATELRQFARIAVEPAVPASVVDLGLRGSPNYELLRSVAPDLILISGFYEYQRPSLERIGPVLTLPIYEAGKSPYPLALSSMLALGERVGLSGEAEHYVADTTAELQQLRTALRSFASRPAFLISLGDARHFRAFGADSMPGDVLTRLGIANAWRDDTSYSAAAPVGIEALARVPEASITVIGPLPAEVSRGLPDNALWNALPAVREGRVAVLEPVNHFGGLPSARRFARLLAEAVAAKAAHD